MLKILGATTFAFQPHTRVITSGRFNYLRVNNTLTSTEERVAICFCDLNVLKARAHVSDALYKKGRAYYIVTISIRYKLRLYLIYCFHTMSNTSKHYSCCGMSGKMNY